MAACQKMHSFFAPKQDAYYSLRNNHKAMMYAEEDQSTSKKRVPIEAGF